eukprot:547098_1
MRYSLQTQKNWPYSNNVAFCYDLNMSMFFSFLSPFIFILIGVYFFIIGSQSVNVVEKALTFYTTIIERNQISEHKINHKINQTDCFLIGIISMVQYVDL